MIDISEHKIKLADSSTGSGLYFRMAESFYKVFCTVLLLLLLLLLSFPSLLLIASLNLYFIIWIEDIFSKHLVAWNIIYK